MPRINPPAPDPRRFDPSRRPARPAPAPPDTTTTRDGNFIHTRPNRHQAAPDQRPLQDREFRAYQPPAPAAGPAPARPPAPGAFREALPPGAPASPGLHAPDALEGAALLLSLAGSPGEPAPPARPRLTLDTALADRFRGPSGDTTITAPPSHVTVPTALPSSAGSGASAPPLLPPHPGSSAGTMSTPSVATPLNGSIYGASVAGSGRPSPMGTPMDELPPLSPFALGPLRLDGPAFDSRSPSTPHRAVPTPRPASPGTDHSSPFDDAR